MTEPVIEPTTEPVTAVDCPFCSGRGTVECDTCGGTGEGDTCDTCEGEGVIYDDDGNATEDCVDCDGEGHYECEGNDCGSMGPGQVECDHCGGEGVVAAAAA